MAPQMGLERLESNESWTDNFDFGVFMECVHNMKNRHHHTLMSMK